MRKQFENVCNEVLTGNRIPDYDKLSNQMTGAIEKITKSPKQAYFSWSDKSEVAKKPKWQSFKNIRGPQDEKLFSILPTQRRWMSMPPMNRAFGLQPIIRSTNKLGKIDKIKSVVKSRNTNRLGKIKSVVKSVMKSVKRKSKGFMKRAVAAADPSKIRSVFSKQSRKNSIRKL